MYVERNIFDNNLVAKQKSKVSLKLNKPAYTGMCILELSKVLMYEFHYDYIRNKYDKKSKLLSTVTDSLMYEIKIEDISENFSSDKEIFDFSYNSTKSKYYDDSNKLVTGQMKNKNGDVAIQEFFGLKAKMCSFLVNYNTKHKKTKCAKKTVVATIYRDEYDMYC